MNIYDAASRGNLNRVRALLNQGVNVNSRDAHDRTPLHWAAYGGSVNVVQELLRRGARINSRDDYYSTPLHVAAHYGRPRVIHALLKAGANPKYRNAIGNTPYNRIFHVSARNASKTSRPATKWLETTRKRKAERMLLSPRLLGSTTLNKNAIRSVARFLTVKKKSPVKN